MLTLLPTTQRFLHQIGTNTILSANSPAIDPPSSQHKTQSATNPQPQTYPGGAFLQTPSAHAPAAPPPKTHPPNTRAQKQTSTARGAGDGDRRPRLTCLALVPGAVERRRDPADDGLRVRLVHRRRRHHVGGPEGTGGARGGGQGGEAAAGDGGGWRRLGEEGAEQDELPAEGRGGGPHAPPVLRLVSPRARGPAHGVMLRPPCGEKLLETVGVVEGWTPGERPEIWSFFVGNKN